MSEVHIVDLIVLVHGIQGPFGDSSKDLSFIKEEILNKFKSKENLNLYIAVCNENSTTDGIETGGKRLAKEIQSEIERIREERKVPVKILLSLIGHSLGGVYSRNAIKHLYENEQIWSQIIPVNLTALSSPHLGVRKPPSLWNNTVEIVAKAYFRGLTIKELFIEDGDFETENKPLLYKMSVPGTPYFNALKEFRHRTLFSLIRGDFQVPYCTSALLPRNYHDRPKTPSTFSVAAHSGFSLTNFEHVFKKDLEKSFDIHTHPGKTEEDHDFKVLHTWMNDNYNEISYLPAMMYNLNKLTWRRVDLDFNSNFGHDFLIRKAAIPFVVNPKPGELAIAMLVDIIVVDHVLTRKEFT